MLFRSIAISIDMDMQPFTETVKNLLFDFDK